MKHNKDLSTWGGGGGCLSHPTSDRGEFLALYKYEFLSF